MVLVTNNVAQLQSDALEYEDDDDLMDLVRFYGNRSVVRLEWPLTDDVSMYRSPRSAY